MLPKTMTSDLIMILNLSHNILCYDIVLLLRERDIIFQFRKYTKIRGINLVIVIVKVATI